MTDKPRTDQTDDELWDSIVDPDNDFLIIPISIPSTADEIAADIAVDIEAWKKANPHATLEDWLNDKRSTTGEGNVG